MARTGIVVSEKTPAPARFFGSDAELVLLVFAQPGDAVRVFSGTLAVVCARPLICADNPVLHAVVTDLEGEGKMKIEGENEGIEGENEGD